MLINTCEGRLPEHLINSAYCTVRKVADNLDAVVGLYEILEKGGDTSQVFSNIRTIIGNMENINAVGDALITGTVERKKAVHIFEDAYNEVE